MLLNIQKDSEWLISMVEKLLSVTWIENEKMKISKTPTILEELIDSSAAKFSQRYPNQKVDVMVPENIVVVSVDSILIEQVILNLLENAVCHAKGMTTSLSTSLQRQIRSYLQCWTMAAALRRTN